MGFEGAELVEMHHTGLTGTVPIAAMVEKNILCEGACFLQVKKRLSAACRLQLLFFFSCFFFSGCLLMVLKRLSAHACEAVVRCME